MKLSGRLALLMGGGRVAAFGLYLAASALAHLVWELVQLPLYTIGQAGTFRSQAFAIVHCTVGDVIIATWALLVALVVTASPAWPHARQLSVAVTTMAIGLVFTGYSEWQNVYVKQTWAYSPMMPTVNIGGIAIGLSPLAQWVIVPALAFLLVHRSSGQHP